MKRPLLIAAIAWMLGELCATDITYISVCMLMWMVYLCFLIRIRKGRVIPAALGITILFFSAGMGRMENLENKYQTCSAIPNEESLILTGDVVTVEEGEYWNTVLIEADLVVEKQTGIEIVRDVQVEVLWKEKPECFIGNKVKITGNKEAFQVAGNPGNFNEEQYDHSRKIALKMKGSSLQMIDARTNYLQEWLFLVKTKLCNNIDVICNKQDASLFKTVIYGDKSTLDSDTRDLYVKNGIAHILAVSGLHMSIAGMGVYRLLRRITSYGISGSVSCVLLCAFGIMTGFGISVRRAFVMMLLRIGADITGRTYDIQSSIALSVLMILAENPYGIYQTSFLLSYSSIFAIGFVCPALEKWMFDGWSRDKKKLRLRLSGILSGAVIYLVNLPVTAYFFFELPTYSVFLNLLVIPLLSLLFLSGMAASFVFFISGDVGIFLSGAGVFVMRIYDILCRFIEKFPYAYVITGRPRKIILVLFYLGIIVLLCWSRYQYQKKCRCKKIPVLLFFVIFQVMLIYAEPKKQGVEISMLDVGQGDCLLIETENGKTILVDGGSSTEKQVAKYKIVPYLKYKGIGKLDYVLISHGDTDHTSGILEIMEEELLDIGEIILPDHHQFEEKYEEIRKLAKKQSIPISFFKAGNQMSQGKLCFEVISPNDVDYDDVNDASMVLYMTYGEFSMYFTGDISSETEEKLLERLQHADVLKIPHHGSKESSCQEFLERIAPVYGLVSCGKENSYGHPHQETLERYQHEKINILNTAQTGCIRLWIPEKEKGTRYLIRTFIS